MFAIVRACHDDAGAELAMADLAGRPLIARQLEWLFGAGIDTIAVEIAGGSAGERVMSYLEQDTLGRRVMCLLSSHACSASTLARRAGFGSGAPVLILEHDMLGDTDLIRLAASSAVLGAVVRIPAPRVLSGLAAGTLRFLGEAQQNRIAGDLGWAVRLRDSGDVRRVAFAILDGSLPKVEGGWALQVHAAEVRPGVWLGRGATVRRGAVLEPPVLIGEGAEVGTDARVGPNAVVGRQAIIDRQAIVRDSVVGEGAIIGEGVALERCDVASDGRVADPVFGEPRSVDPLLVASGRRNLARTSVDRLVARVLLALLGISVLALSPIVLAGLVFGARGTFDRARALAIGLMEVAAGTRALVGVGQRAAQPAAPARLREAAALAPPGLLDIEHGLVGEDASPLARLGAHAWYARHKSARVDIGLLLRSLRSSRRVRRDHDRQVSFSSEAERGTSSCSSASRR